RPTGGLTPLRRLRLLRRPDQLVEVQPLGLRHPVLNHEPAVVVLNLAHRPRADLDELHHLIRANVQTRDALDLVAPRLLVGVRRPGRQLHLDASRLVAVVERLVAGLPPWPACWRSLRGGAE